MHLKRSNNVTEQQTQAASLKHENEVLLETLHKEQDKSYKLLRDLHLAMQENKANRSQLDEQRVQLEQMHIAQLKASETAQDNHRLQAEIARMQAYVNEQETSMEGLRERIRDSERNMGQQIEQSRMLEAHIDKVKQEAGDMKRSLLSQNDRISQMDQQMQFQLKENDDLKHDNTVLYQKNIQNKERLDKVGVEVEELKHYIEGEKQKNA